MGLRVFHVIVGYVVLSTLLPVLLHLQVHGRFSAVQAALAFFLPLNTLICLWEVSLGLNISLIESDLKKLSAKYGADRFRAVGDLFLSPVSVAEALTLRYWSRIWSTYALYDPSYANRESFGFFVDVGNGWTTLLPSLYLLLCMTFHEQANNPLLLPARWVGMLSLVIFYQEFYGTCIYFLSFFLNGRHRGKSLFEVALFVGLSNGLWFFLPLLGMWASGRMITEDSFAVFTS